MVDNVDFLTVTCYSLLLLKEVNRSYNDLALLYSPIQQNQNMLRTFKDSLSRHRQPGIQGDYRSKNDW